MGVDNNSILECPKGHQISVRIGNFKNGTRCGVCNNVTGRNSKYTEEYVRNYLKKYDYELIKYNKSYLHMIIKCPDGHISNKATFRNFQNGVRCRKCDEEKGKYYLKFKNKKLHLELKLYLRGFLKKTNWYKNTLKAYNYRCALTNERDDIHIHHIKNFNTLLTDTLTELNLHQTKELKFSHLYQIKKLFVKKHEECELGIVLRTDIHKLFHNLYGLKK